MKAIWNYYPEGYSIQYVEVENGEAITKLRIFMNDRAHKEVEVSRGNSRIPKTMWEEDKHKDINDLESSKKQDFIKRLFRKFNV